VTRPAAGGVPGSQAAGGQAAQRPPGGPERPAQPPSPWRSAFFVLAGLAIVTALGWALLESKLLAVHSVVVTGTRLVPAREVRATAAIPLGMPMIRVSPAAVAARVERIQQVESAQVRRVWPDRVVIAVRERTPVLAVAVPGSASAAGTAAAEGGFGLIDKSGVIVRWSRSRPHGMPLYQAAAGPRALRGSPDVAAAAAVLRELPAPVARSVRQVSAPSPQEVTLHLPGGVTIVWGGTGRPAEKRRELDILMRTHARFYDVSAPGTAVTR